MTRFVDFNLEPAVIEELMYGESGKLVPWSLGDTLEAEGFDGDLWEYSAENYYDQVRPEAQAYFRICSASSVRNALRPSFRRTYVPGASS